MLLVTFHGGSSGVDNVFGYDTSTGALNTQHALQGVTLAKPELRGLVYANSLLYVVNGEKKASDILCLTPPKKSDAKYHFSYVGEFLGPSLDKHGEFGDGIAHPYAMVFDDSGSNCYVSNQDTNVVAQAAVGHHAQKASLGKGCQSGYLKGLTSICPKSGCVYLDGTFVASQNGSLPNVSVQATNVPGANGGLAVDFATTAEAAAAAPKVQNSVRDLAVWDKVLLVCDEPAKVLRLYALKDGTYLGASAALAAAPTHLALFSGGLYVSAGSALYWSALASPPTAAGLKFQSVLAAPANNKVGGVAFDAKSNVAYVAFQDGTGTTGTGSIYSYPLGTPVAAPPVFGAATKVADSLPDTPEFLLFADL